MYNNNFVKDKFFYEDYKSLNKLESTLFQALIKVTAESTNTKKKYQELAKFLIRRFTIWKPTPFFPIYLCDISVEIKKQLMHLPEPILDDLMISLIDKIMRHSLQNEEIFSYNYFIKEVRESGFLRWRMI